MERQRQGIDAVALSGRWRTVIKHMAQMRFAAAADQFVADHEKAFVDPDGNIFLGNGFIVTGPAGAGIELVLRMVQIVSAGGTAVNTVIFVFQQLAGKGSLSPFFAQDMKPVCAEHFSPFVLGLNHTIQFDVIAFSAE